MPRDHLIQFARQYGGVWRIVDAIRQARDRDDPAWPEHVYLPLERAGEALARWHAEHDPRPLHPSTLVGPASVLAGLAAWRVTQGIYRYDPTLYAALADTPLTGDIPGELLTRLPEWCVYLETPGMVVPLVGGGEMPLHGVWAWMDRVRTDRADVLTLMMHVDGMERLPIGHVPLVGTLDAALARVEADWRDAIARGNADGYPARGYADVARRTFAPILSLLLYLCAEGAEIGDGTARPMRPQPKRTKLGWRLFPADKPTAWDVGIRLGAALRRGYQQQELGQEEFNPQTGRARPRAHIRRAHWHTFLAGAGRSERRLKWLPPIPVNVDDIDAIPATVRPVK